MTTDATKTVEEFTAEAQKSMEDGMEKMTKSMEDAAVFGRQNMDAMVASSKRAAKAAEELNAEIAAYTKKAYEDGLAAAKEMTSAKSVTELFEKQSAYAKTSMEGFVAQATKMSELFAAASKECFDPLTERFTAATEIFKAERA